jgi:hypothetical protein
VLSLDKFKKTDHGTFHCRLDSAFGITVTGLNDNSVVTLVSNCHGIKPLGTAKGGHGPKESLWSSPSPVIDPYNRYVGRVDRMEIGELQHNTAYPSDPESDGGLSLIIFLMWQRIPKHCSCYKPTTGPDGLSLQHNMHSVLQVVQW